MCFKETLQLWGHMMTLAVWLIYALCYYLEPQFSARHRTHTNTKSDWLSHRCCMKNKMIKWIVGGGEFCWLKHKDASVSSDLMCIWITMEAQAHTQKCLSADHKTDAICEPAPGLLVISFSYWSQPFLQNIQHLLKYLASHQSFALIKPAQLAIFCSSFDWSHWLLELMCFAPRLVL